MKKAWVENNRIKDVCHGNPSEVYHPSVAQFYSTDVPDEAENGMEFVNNQWQQPLKPSVTVDPSSVASPVLSAVQFKLLFTSAERVALNQAKASDPVIADFFSLVDDPRLLEIRLGSNAVASAIQYMVDNDYLEQARADKILKGEEP
jgi:hypothetical protein